MVIVALNHIKIKKTGHYMNAGTSSFGMQTVGDVNDIREIVLVVNESVNFDSKSDRMSTMLVVKGFVVHHTDPEQDSVSL
jgi:hypothetical protein